MKLLEWNLLYILHFKRTAAIFAILHSLCFLCIALPIGINFGIHRDLWMFSFAVFVCILFPVGYTFLLYYMVMVSKQDLCQLCFRHPELLDLH